MTETTALATTGETSLMVALPADIEDQVRDLIRITKLNKTQAETVLNKFAVGFDPFLRLRDEAQAIVVSDPSQTELINRAKQIDKELLEATKVLADIHLQEKEFWLRGGQMVDGCKRIPTNAIAAVRSHLKQQIDYVRNLEIARLDKQEAERIERLAEYGGVPNGMSVRTMTDDQFEIVAVGTRAAFLQRAEEERQERERLMILQEENARLTRERDEAERAATAERLERERIEEERQRLEREKQAEIDRVAREKAEEERQVAALEEAKRLAPDKAKLEYLSERIHAITLDMPVVDPKFEAMLDSIRGHLTAAIGMIETQITMISNDCPF